MKNTLKNIINIITIIVILTSLNGCTDNNSSQVHQITGIYFDTVVSITIYDENVSELSPNIYNEIQSKLTFYDTLFSESNENSDIFKINNNQNPELSNETIALISDSLKIAKLSSGKLDPSIAAVSELYSFDTNEHDIPSKINIKKALSSVDYTSLSISGNRLIKNNPDTKITLGFIAKGYIADQICETLKENNVKGALINLGGNIMTYGNKPDNSNFNIGIEKPFEENTPILSLNVPGNTTVVTSGIYERYFTNNSQIYSHIINTSTGYPITNDLYSVTVIGPSSKTADMLSTLLLIEGYENTEKYLNNYPEYSAIFISNDYSIIYSNNFDMNLIN